jgi:tRNA(fMet)-specific endonuclease VapC
VRFLLDTNSIIALLKGHHQFLKRMRQHQPQDVAVSAIVAHELFYGAFKGQRTVENLTRIDALRFEVLEFDREDALQSGQLRATLTTSGTPIGPYDVLIAGQAIARGLTLITHNLREFQRAAGLQVEDWEV